jgi:dephospho-CoA kinase
MKVFGLTGGIGSGKTTVGNIFKTLGVSVYNADERARWLTNNNSDIKYKLKATFGDKIFNSNNSLDKNKLASIVFNNEKELKKLNIIIHPEVKLDFAEWCKIQKGNYVLKESAIIFENGLEKELDGVIGVIASEEIRIKRVISRSKLTEVEIRARMNNQMNQEELKYKCNWIVNNNEDELVLPQVLTLYKILNDL